MDCLKPWVFAIILWNLSYNATNALHVTEDNMNQYITLFCKFLSLFRIVWNDIMIPYNYADNAFNGDKYTGLNFQHV